MLQFYTYNSAEDGRITLVDMTEVGDKVIWKHNLFERLDENTAVFNSVIQPYDSEDGEYITWGNEIRLVGDLKKHILLHATPVKRYEVELTVTTYVEALNEDEARQIAYNGALLDACESAIIDDEFEVEEVKSNGS